MENDVMIVGSALQKSISVAARFFYTKGLAHVACIGLFFSFLHLKFVTGDSKPALEMRFSHFVFNLKQIEKAPVFSFETE